MEKQAYSKGTILYLTKEARQKVPYRWFALSPLKVVAVYDHHITEDIKDPTGHIDFTPWRVNEYLYELTNANCRIYGDELTQNCPELLKPPLFDERNQNIIAETYRLSWLYSILSLNFDGKIISEYLAYDTKGRPFTASRKWDVLMSCTLGDGHFSITVPEEVHYFSPEKTLCALRRLCDSIDFKPTNNTMQLYDFKSPNNISTFQAESYFTQNALDRIKQLFGPWYSVLKYSENDLQNEIAWK